MNETTTIGAISFVDAVIESLDYIEYASKDSTSTKDDVLDAMRNRMSILISRATLHNYSSSMSFNGWRVDDG
jgi:hypothetical protein